MIAGVQVTPKRVIADERGAVMHMLRADQPQFVGFGEVYFSAIHPGAVKAWKVHTRMTMNLTVPVGRVRFVLFDDRADSPTRGQVQEVLLSPEQHALLTVPPGIWNGFRGEGDTTSLIANCADIGHSPEEVLRIENESPLIPYSWS